MIKPEKYKNKYRNDSTRLKDWDYGSPGYYFVTICTQDRECYFGDIGLSRVGTQDLACLHATTIGKVAHQYWMEIPDHFPFVILDEFVVMPDHIHGILQINKPDYLKWNKNSFAPQSQNLASVIRGFKAGVKTYSTRNDIKFLWQSRYHDHVIRSQRRLEIIREYIKRNPVKWLEKKNSNNNSYKRSYETELSTN